MALSAKVPRAVLGRDALLDAAEAVILRESIGRLTLDAVAAEARGSKGGLLHHFPSKERLIEAMVHRIVATWRADTLAEIRAESPGPGRVPRAMIRIALGRPMSWKEQCRRSSVVLLAALVERPALVEPMRIFHRELSDLIAKDGLPPGVGEAVSLAIDGLWFKWIFGLGNIGGSRTKALRGVLEGLTACAARANDVQKSPRASGRAAQHVKAGMRTKASRPREIGSPATAIRTIKSSARSTTPRAAKQPETTQ